MLPDEIRDKYVSILNKHGFGLVKIMNTSVLQFEHITLGKNLRVEVDGWGYRLKYKSWLCTSNIQFECIEDMIEVVNLIEQGKYRIGKKC